MSTHSETLSFESMPRQEQVLHDRIRAEYREMPGMKLTLPQAARLFHMERTQCARLLNTLVQKGDLAAKAGLFGLPEWER